MCLKISILSYIILHHYIHPHFIPPLTITPTTPSLCPTKSDLTPPYQTLRALIPHPHLPDSSCESDASSSDNDSDDESSEDDDSSSMDSCSGISDGSSHSSSSSSLSEGPVKTLIDLPKKQPIPTNKTFVTISRKY